MPGEEVLELGRCGPRPAPSTRPPAPDVEPFNLDLQRDEAPIPPVPPRRVRIIVGVAAVGVVTGVLMGAVGWHAFDDRRAMREARGAVDIVAVLSGTGTTPDLGAVSATFTIFNSGEHPIKVEGITMAALGTSASDRVISREIGPGESGLVHADLSVDCASTPKPSDKAMVDVRTVDGEFRSTTVTVVEHNRLAGPRDWICSPNRRPAPLWADVGSPVRWGDRWVMLQLHVRPGRERETIVGLDSAASVFSVESTTLPVTVDPGVSPPIETIWRVADCDTAQDFETTGGAGIRVHLADGRSHDVNVSHGAGFGALVRLAERICRAN